MRLLDPLLQGFVRRGRLTVIDARGRAYAYGAPDPALPEVRARFADRTTPYRIARNPDTGTAEALMEERLVLEAGTIRDLVNLVQANNRWDHEGEYNVDGPLRTAFKTARHRIDRLNWRGRAKRNVAHHYDLSGRLYELFLDADRQYSCAYFTDPDATLEQAQLDKTAHILAKLRLEPGVSLLDIGCGWGGMALAAHKVTGGEVLGVTLSEEQLKVARARAEAAGVAGKVRFELMDYRDVRERFDRIVSVGMFEHVGPPFYRRFFAECARLLGDDGVMLLHTIGRMGAPGITDRFTAKYIFPGGYIPALSEIVGASEPARLIAADVETLRLHYAWTLDRWYDRTVAAHDEIVALYDEAFYKLWLFYLAGAAAAFRYGAMCNYQLQYIRRRDALPVTRDYIAGEERRIRAILAA